MWERLNDWMREEHRAILRGGPAEPAAMPRWAETRTSSWKPQILTARNMQQTFRTHSLFITSLKETQYDTRSEKSGDDQKGNLPASICAVPVIFAGRIETSQRSECLQLQDQERTERRQNLLLLRRRLARGCGCRRNAGRCSTAMTREVPRVKLSKCGVLPCVHAQRILFDGNIYLY